MINKNCQAGQALLLVLFAITLGLVSLVGVSMRTVTSTRRVFIDNAYYKAQAAAEAGAEAFLLKANRQLDTFLDSCGPTKLFTAQGFVSPLPAVCVANGSVVEFSESRAVVAVETYPASGEDTYEVSAPVNTALGINLVGADSGRVVEVCWQGTSSTSTDYAEILAFYYSEAGGGTFKLTQHKHTCYESLPWCSSSPPGSYSASAGVRDSKTHLGEYSCFDVPMTDTPYLLNLVALVNGATYKIKFAGHVPAQGYKITSIGEVKSGAATGGSLVSSSAARKKVVVARSNTPRLGLWFNFAAASETGELVAE
jgi:hypothetical protein